MSIAAQRVLVTGGAGFIGSHLVDRLLARGDTVVCVDNFVLGRRENLVQASTNSRFTLHELDVLNMDRLDMLFATSAFDRVYHLAANSDIQAGNASTERDLSLTFQTTYNVLECMRRHRVRQLLFTSTGAIFGQQPGPLHERSSVAPESLYGASKLASEAFIMAFAGLYDIQSWIVRLPNVVGERTTHGLIHDVLRKLAANPPALEVLGDGTQRKPYMYVHDLIDTFMFIFERCREPLNVLNVGPRDAVSVAEIAELVLQAAGASQPIAYTGGSRGWAGDVPLYSYDTSKMECLGWKLQSTSIEAIRRAVAAILASR